MNHCRPSPTSFRRIYFLFSVACLIFRTCVASFALAGINDESKKPIKILRSVSSDSWNTETQRFINEVTVKNIALTGMGLFSVTRKMILSVIGTIITYELVLYQSDVNNAEYAICS